METCEMCTEPIQTETCEICGYQKKDYDEKFIGLDNALKNTGTPWNRGY